MGHSQLTWRWFDFENTRVDQKTATNKNLFHHMQTNNNTEYKEYEKLCVSAVHKYKPVKLPAQKHT